MGTPNFEILHVGQRVVYAEWDQIPEGDRERYIRGSMVRALADKLSADALMFQEHDPRAKKDFDPTRDFDRGVTIHLEMGVLRGKTDVARYAMQLEEAERRGADRALAQLRRVAKGRIESLSNPVDAAAAEMVVESSLARVRGEMAEAKRRSWKPMSFFDRRPTAVEFYFENGQIHNDRVLNVPILRMASAIPDSFDGDQPTGDAYVTLEAIGWRDRR